MKKILLQLLKGSNKFTVLSIVVICLMYVTVMFYTKAQTGVWGHAFLNKAGQVSVGVLGETEPDIGGVFRLQGADGVFTEANLEGKYSLLFFGYTHCPDVCPTELSKLANVIEKLPDDIKASLQVIFISVDSKRDTVEYLKDYVTSFNKEFIGLTGTKAQIDHIAKQYLVYYKIHAPDEGAEGDNYRVDHSGYTYLMGADGVYITRFGLEASVADIVEKLVELPRIL